MTLAEFFRALRERSNDSMAHCAYEWSVKKDNVFEHDMMIVCYETAEIMSTSGIGSIGGTRLNVASHAPVNSRSLALQVIENKDSIVPYLMFNQMLYSKEKISRTVAVFSDLLDRIMKAEDPGQINVSQFLSVPGDDR